MGRYMYDGRETQSRARGLAREAGDPKLHEEGKEADPGIRIGEPK